MSLGIASVGAMMVAAYILFLVASVYFCVFADPDESPTALFLTETVPTKAWSLLQRHLPKSSLAFLQFVMDQAMAVIYLIVVLGCCSITIWYIFPWLHAQSYVAQYHKYIALLFMVAALSSWRKICICSPGIITSKTVARYQHFPFDELLFVSGQMCKTTGILRPARSKFDRYRYHANVARFDHYCGWTINTIGEENYRYFLLFLLVHFVMCTYGAYTISQLFYGHLLERHLLDAIFVDRVTGKEIPASKWILFQYLFNRFTLEAGQCLLMGVMSIALGLFLGYHCYLTSINMTTNEAYKWEQVNKWYKRELKRYNDAVARGEIVVNDNKNSRSNSDDNETNAKDTSTMTGPTVTDGDVTCTPPIIMRETTTTTTTTNTTTGQQQQQQQVVLDAAAAAAAEDVIQHPGPKPINIYNRGFIENWKEVIFPISLRKTPSARSTKPKLT